MKRWLVALGVVAAAAVGLAGSLSLADVEDEPALSGDAGLTAPPVGPDAGTSDQHWRMDTGRGPVHVWVPDGYQDETAGIVAYVHGYYTDVDEAWARHRLASQFAASGLNALFIVPEAPVRGWHEVRWSDLGELIRTVRQSLGLRRPWGPVVAMGHSGAYRTLLGWLEYRPLEHVILLDGLYGHEEPFAEWLAQVKATRNRLTMISIDTLRWSEPWARDIGDVYTLDWSPDSILDLDAKARDSRLLYIRSQYDHMEIVTEGRVIPVLLQATSVPALPGRGS